MSTIKIVMVAESAAARKVLAPTSVPATLASAMLRFRKVYKNAAH